MSERDLRHDFYVLAKRILLRKLGEFRMPKQTLFKTLVLLLHPSMNPFVQGTSKELTISLNQLWQAFVQSWNSGRSMTSTARSQSASRFLPSVERQEEILGMWRGFLERHPDLSEQVAEAASEKGYGLLVQFAESQEEMQECVNDMQKKKVAGLILDSEKLVNTRKLEDATVYLCQTKEFDERQKATFYYRLSEAGRLAAERLMREGHEKIACVTLKKDRTIQDGYRLAMREANLAVQPLWSYEGKCLEDIEKYGIQQCLGEKVSAVICGSPEIAGCFYKTIERLQISLPDSISMISIGDGKWMAEFDKYWKPLEAHQRGRTSLPQTTQSLHVKQHPKNTQDQELT